MDLQYLPGKDFSLQSEVQTITSYPLPRESIANLFLVNLKKYIIFRHI